MVDDKRKLISIQVLVTGIGLCMKLHTHIWCVWTIHPTLVHSLHAVQNYIKEKMANVFRWCVHNVNELDYAFSNCQTEIVMIMQPKRIYEWRFYLVSLLTKSRWQPRWTTVEFGTHCHEQPLRHLQTVKYNHSSFMSAKLS